jgi:putative aldouronate transport system permease protein
MFCAYFMAAKNMLFKVPVILLMTFTMFFSGGLVPIYLNIRWLGIYNSHWALVLPFAMSLFNAIITKTAIDGLPDSLTESAYIDGANDLTILFRIVIPLIIPTVAVIMLYYTVGHWNSWFAASIFIQDQRKMPLQVILRSILIQNIDMFGDRTQTDQTIRQRYTETIKYAVIVMSTAPILLVYPFIQRYFVKGVMIGAIKG